MIDTDWLIDYLTGKPLALELIESLIPAELSISIVTYAEAYEGIYFGHDPEHFETVFNSFLVAATVLGISEDVARVWATLRGTLRRTGQLIPPSDLFIAATAIHHDLVLVSRNLSHFERVPGLKLFSIPQ